MKDIIEPPEMPPRRYRTLFLSDLHLGSRSAQTDALLDLLRRVDADTIYLVGDIIDFWKIRRGVHWPQSHNDVIQKLLRKARKGTRLVYIPGNHDEAIRQYAGSSFGGIEIVRNARHVAADGRQYLVMHGDEFDLVIRNAKWLAWLGDIGYELAMSANTPVNWARKRLGLRYWSLSAFLKLRVKQAVNFIGAFEAALASEAGSGGYDGVICGHIHHAADRRIGRIHYLNCGDWVESCTAIVEDDAGRHSIVRAHHLIPLPAHQARSGRARTPANVQSA
jgi:UDP-2,3-diacylglucosamine pyrophosphatase LpxH